MGWLIAPPEFLPVAEKLVQFNTSGGQGFLQYGAVAALGERNSLDFGEPHALAVAQFV